MTAPTPNPFAPVSDAPVTMPRRVPRRAGGVAGSTFERRFLSERYRGGAGMLEVAALWRNNVIAVDSYREATAPITIGADQATYLVESASLLDTTALVEPVGGRWVLHVGHGMDGFVVAAGRDGRSRRMSFQEAVVAGHARPTAAGFDVTIGGATRARVSIGEQSFLLHFVSAPALRLPLVARVGLAGLGLAVLLSLAAHLIFGAMVSMSTDRVDELTLDQMTAANRYGETLVVPEAVEDEEIEKELAEADSEDAETHGEAMSGNTDQADGAGVIAHGASRPELGRGRARGNQGDVMPADLARTLDAINGIRAAGDFDETLVAWNHFDSGDVMKPGGYVLGPADAGRIGGRESLNLPGPIDTGRRSREDGPGDHPIDLNARADLDPVKPTHKPTLKPQRFDSSGTLTALQIRKIVQQHKRELTSLYGKQLARDKALHGKIVVSFIIDASGNVVPESVRVASSTMDNEALERGLVSSIKRWRFPAVRGGGMTKVSYPFVFDVK